MEKILYDAYGNELKPGQTTVSPAQRLADAIRKDPGVVGSLVQEAYDNFGSGKRNDVINASHIFRELGAALELLSNGPSFVQGVKHEQSQEPAHARKTGTR